jgi:hypothetical protein
MAVIVFESNAGHTENYARMLGEIVHVPVFSYKHAKRALQKGEEVFFMGWLCAETIKGYKKAQKLFHLSGVCAVGMTPEDMIDLDRLRKQNEMNGEPVFYLQGGIEMDKLSGIYKKMISVMSSFLQKEEANGTISEKDAEMVSLIKNSTPCMRKENLHCIVDWWK